MLSLLIVLWCVTESQVKRELTPFLRLLSPSNLANPMSIVSLGADVGARRSLYREASSGSGSGSGPAGSGCGEVEVEDVLVGDHVHRRLVFGAGGGLVQSEARLNVAPNFLTMTPAQRKQMKAKLKKKKNAAAAKKKAANIAGDAASATAAAESKDKDDEADGDDADDGADDTPAAASASASSSSSPSASLICYNYLPCEYQHGLLAMLALYGAAAPSPSAPSSASPSPATSMPALPARATLIGLGGGSFAMFLHFALPALELHVR